MKRFVLILIVLVGGCTLEDQKNGVSTDDILKFDALTLASVSADNTSVLPVKIVLGPNVGSEQEITFKTDQGRFQGIAAESNQKELKMNTSLKTASVNLIADTKPNSVVGISASITAGSKTYTITKQISFDPAYPSQMFLTTDKQIIVPDQNSAATLTHVTIRDAGKGKVSDDLVVSVRDSVTTGNLLVDVVPIVKTSSERATITVKSRNTEDGTVFIIASILNTTTGKVIRATRSIQFKK